MTDNDLTLSADSSGTRGVASAYGDADTSGSSVPHAGPLSPDQVANHSTAVDNDESPPIDRPVKKSGSSAIREVAETLILALVIFVAVRALVLNFRVDGRSMLPNLTNQEMLLVNRNVYFHFDLNNVLNLLPGEDRDGDRIVYPFHPPERGDIVVFTPPTVSDKPYIKRVVGLPGDTITIRDGSVFVGDQTVDEPYIDDGITECTRDDCTWEVPDGHVFVLGDNRTNSSDSRSFGPIAIDSIIGKAWLSYWPFGEFGLVPHYDYPEINDR